jgi:hypothetical protein
MVAFRALLLPVWRVDLFLKGRAELEEVSCNLCCESHFSFGSRGGLEGREVWRIFP